MVGSIGDQELSRLLERARRSDPAAWNALVERHQALVYSIPRRYGLNDDDAEDVFITTFQALHSSLDRIENAQTLPKWLAVTAARRCLHIKRLSARTVSAEDRSLNLDEIVASEDRDAEEEAITAERALGLREGLVRLGGRCQDLLNALYIEVDVSYQEISDRFRMPLGAIGPTRARCLAKLKKILEDKGFFQ